MESLGPADAIVTRRRHGDRASTLTGSAADSTRVMTLYGQTMARTSAIYALGMLGVVPAGLLSLAITTRFLEPADFGRLAILFAFAALLTIMCGLGSLQGTLLAAYGVGADDGGGDGIDIDIDEGDRDPAVVGRERRRIMGSGLLVVILEATLFCGVVALWAPAIADVFLGSSSWSPAVRLMALSAWTGAVWRMVHQVFRMERRPAVWSSFQWLRPLLVIAMTVPALVSGLGIEGVLVATAAGTALSAGIAVGCSRGLYILSPRREDIRTIWDAGKPWIPLTIAMAVQGSLNVLLLGLIAPAAAVGLYQAASRIAIVPIYFGHGFLMGWAPLERAAISQAGRKRKGRREFAASVFTLFVLTTLGLVFVVSLASEVLIRVAAPAYQSAAPLIPVVAAALAAHLVFRGVYRACSFPHKRYWFVAMHLLWLVPYGLVAAVLIPVNPSYAVAVASLAAGAAATVWFVVLDRRGGSPTPFEWARLARATLAAAACVAVAAHLPVGVSGHLVLALVALVAFPFVLMALGVIDRAQMGVVRAILGEVLPSRHRARVLDERLALLSGQERDLLRLLERHRWRLTPAALDSGMDRRLLSARIVRALRKLNGEGRATSLDDQIGDYIAGPDTTLERDLLGDRLQRLGVDPLQLYTLDELVRRLRAPLRKLPKQVEPAARVGR